MYSIKRILLGYLRTIIVLACYGLGMAAIVGAYALAAWLDERSHRESLSGWNEWDTDQPSKPSTGESK